jgi:hypothetical protein
MIVTHLCGVEGLYFPPVVPSSRFQPACADLGKRRDGCLSQVRFMRGTICELSGKLAVSRRTGKVLGTSLLGHVWPETVKWRPRYTFWWPPDFRPRKPLSHSAAERGARRRVKPKERWAHFFRQIFCITWARALPIVPVGLASCRSQFASHSRPLSSCDFKLRYRRSLGFQWRSRQVFSALVGYDCLTHIAWNAAARKE